MGRPKALDRKQQLLEEILEYLRTRTLSSVTFRTLADALGVSSYVLVYQFGNREALLGDIVREVDYRVMYNDLSQVVEQNFAEFEENTRRVSGSLFAEENRHLLRLQTEAATMDVVAEKPKRQLATYMDLWHKFVAGYLAGLGLDEDAVESLSMGFLNELNGIRFDFVLNGGADRASRGLDTALARLRDAIVLNLGEEKALKAFETRVATESEAPSLALKNRPNPAR